VSRFLEKTNLYNLIQSFSLDPEVLKDLMITLCSNVKYEFFKKGDILYKIGEPAEKFFLILKGEIKVYKLKKKLVNMTKKEYILFIKTIKDSKDPYLLKKTIITNKEKMEINDYEIPRLMEKISRIHLIRLDLEKKKYYRIRLEGKYTKSFENFIEEIDAGMIVSNCIPEDIKAKLYDYTGITESDKEEDAIIFDEEKYQVRIFDYEENEVFSNGNYFGENGSNAIDRKRTQYIVANADTECMSISNDIYQKNILTEFQKLKNKEISFLNENCIFKNIQKGTFLNQYFKYFKIEEFFRGENIFIEMQKSEKVYFIKEGRIELNLYTNILKMHNYAKELMSINSEITNHFKDEEKLPVMNLQPKNYMEILEKKKFVSLFLFQENDMLGIEEAYANFKHLYRATVISDRAYLYSIPVNKFKKMIEFEPKIINDFKNYSFMKICILIKRLSNLKNDLLKFIDGNHKEDNTKKNANNETADKEKNEKKASSAIHIINQVNLKKNQSQSDLNLIVIHKSKKQIKNKNEKGKIKKSNESIAEELARYYKDYQNWNKQLNKKWDLLLNPQADEFQFYKQINFELNTIKSLKSDINKFSSNSIANILPKINLFNNASELNTAGQIETTSDNENILSSGKAKENNYYNNKDKGGNFNLNSSKKKTEKISIEKNSNCESSDESLPKGGKETDMKSSNKLSINEGKFKKGKISSKNLCNTIVESITNNFSNNINTEITIKINPNAFTTRLSSSILNKNKRINAPQSNLFMTNIYSKNEQLPTLNEKNCSLEHQLNVSIEAINYNHVNISSKSFRNADIRKTIISEKKTTKLDNNLLKTSKEKTVVNTIFNFINEEIIKNTENAENASPLIKLGKFEVKKNTNVDIFNNRKNQNTAESSENDEIKIDVFGSTKSILSQSVILKTNKLRRLHREYMPRYYSNKFCNNSNIEELNESNENLNKECKKEDFKSPKNDMKRQMKDDPIEVFMSKKSSNFVPFSVDNSVNGIKKLNKRIQMLAPKKKYNFIINNY